MQCNINNVKRICGFNQAARYFEETKKPRSAKWSDDERPLYNTRSHHYRILKGNDNGTTYYDLVLYSTSMIRYYQPDSNNHHRVLVRGHYSSASGNFLWHHGFARNRNLYCVDANGQGREGKLLLNHYTEKATDHGVPHGWSADLLFIGAPDDGYKVLLDKSRHIPGYKAATSPEDSAKRKHLKTLCDHWIELLGYRLDEYLNTEIAANSWRVRNAGNSFTSALEMLGYNEQDDIKSAVEAALGGDDQFMDGEVFTNAMTKLGHAVATHLKGVRENKARGRWNYNTRQYDREPLEPVTRADFRKSMESHLISLLNLRTGSARVEMGQFPESVPRKWWC